MTERFDVIIMGGGLVGLTLGIGLSQHGVRCAVIDPATPETTLTKNFDGRVSSLSSASWKLFQAIGIAERLEGKGCPIERIWVSDGLQPGVLDFTPPQDDATPMGIMFENRETRLALRNTALAAEHLTLFQPDKAAHVERTTNGVSVTLGSGAKLHASLLVGAEGRASPTREAANIPVAKWDYKHVAMVTAINHEVNHSNTAYEIFYPGGPFAILPMNPGTRSAIVWTVPERQAAGMMALGERGWLAEAQKRMGGFLGEIALAGPRSCYRLGYHRAARITDMRLALVGDAAHGIHPIAGQGVNLGFRDAAALIEVIVTGMRLGLEPGDAQLLTRYQRWRSLDTLSVTIAMDGLVRLFDVPGRIPSAIRRVGLATVQKMEPLKNRFMVEARGESGALPKLLAGEMV